MRPSCRLLRAWPAILSCAVASALAACRPAPPADAPVVDGIRRGPASDDAGTRRLPTGQRLDPAGREVDVLAMPLALVPTPDGRALVLLASGAGAQGVQVLDRATGRVTQTVEQRSAFVGLAFAPDGRTLYASGGDGDVVYRYAWDGRALARTDSLVLAPHRTAGEHGTRYPAGLAPSPDGRRLYVAENLADSLAVVDVASGRVVQRLATGRYPYGVAVAPSGRVFVSAWGAGVVHAFDPAPNGAPNDAPNDAPHGPALARAGDAPAARHPSALLLDAAAARLYVASASTDRVVALDARTLAPAGEWRSEGAPAGPREGATPNALVLAPDGRTLFTADADANAVGAFALGDGPNGGPAGRLPAGWYPTALAVLGDTLYVANGKGRGTRANPAGPQPVQSRERANAGARGRTTLTQLGGTVMAVPLAAAARPAPALADRVRRANGWDRAVRDTAAAARAAYPPFEHVVYVVKENRTYDQVFGDLPAGDGDSALVFFPRAVTPNHHALAERFGLYDRFFVNAEVSADGHNWSMAAYATDYVQKTVPSNYSNRGRSYDYEGTNRGFGAEAVPEDDAAEPASGYLWDLARRAGRSFRNYGEFVVPPTADPRGLPDGYRGVKPFLRDHTDPRFPGYDLDVPDQRRADEFIRELGEFSRTGRMPALTVMRLPNDHTAGARKGAPTPRAYLADNDLALGRVVEALSRSPFWRSTVVFVLEDDAQNGPDHVDAHRSPLLVISPYGRPGTVRRWANTTDVLATIEEILGLGALSHFDHYGRPLRGVWARTPDLRPYAALAPAVPLGERNTASNTTPADRRASARLALEIEDQADEDTFNRVLWRTVKGAGVPYPGARRVSGHALVLAAAGR